MTNSRLYDIEISEEDARVIHEALNKSLKHYLHLYAIMDKPVCETTEEERAFLIDNKVHDPEGNRMCFKCHIGHIKYLLDKFDPSLLGY